jgi:micrococcal nuclease
VYEYKAIVDRVVDGDTVDFYVDLGFSVGMKIRTRLAGVDTPERGQPDFLVATQKCRELLNKAAASFPYEGKIVIKTEKTGKYGRWIVHIQGVTDELARIWPYER